jgi:pimeloyl-ACP methyl ester carboxylesterase
MKHVSIVIFTLILLSSCAKTYQGYAPDYRFDNPSTEPDYSQLNYWAAHPDKKDPSDSLVNQLQPEVRDSSVDVFFIYPTTYTGKRQGWNADINDAGLNAKTDYTSILYQASVFNRDCRVFAPRYRQAHFSAFFIPAEDSKPYFDTAYADVKKAFAYYLAHENKGRPMIIAGHSQGAMMAERLLKEFFDNKPLTKLLVAAYIVGWPIPQNSFEQLPVCSSPEQTGCFCGWRTFREGYRPRYVKREKDSSYVTNPLSWDTTETFIPKEENKGSVLREYNKVIPHTTGARLSKGVLWATRPHFPGWIFYRTKNYHIADMNLFYVNLRENVGQRIHAYFKKP